MKKTNDSNAKTKKNNLTKITIKLVNAIFFIAGFICITFGCLMLIKENITVAGTGLGAGLVLLLVATIDRFKSFKGAGIEVYTRKLKDKIVEADDTIKELRQLSELSGHTLSLLLSSTAGNNKKINFEKGHNLIQQLREILEGLNCDELTIAKTILPWRDTALVDMTAHIMAPVMIRLTTTRIALIEELKRIKDLDVGNEDTPLLKNSVDALTKYLDTTKHPYSHPAEKITEAMKQFIVEAPDLTEDEKEKFLSEIEPWIPEIEFFITHNYIKSPHLWNSALSA